MAVNRRHRVSKRSCGQATFGWNRGIKMSLCITDDIKKNVQKKNAVAIECKNISINVSVAPKMRMHLLLLLISLQKTSIRNKSDGLWVHPVN